MYVINEKRRAEDTALMLEYGSRVVKNGKKQILPLRNADDLQGILFHNEKDDPKVRSFLKSVKPMDETWKNRVQQDFWWGRKGREAGIAPILYKLRDKLLTFGGESVCLSFGEPDAEEILACGQFWAVLARVQGSQEKRAEQPLPREFPAPVPPVRVPALHGVRAFR